jgi:hypothetical protein
MSVRAQWPRWLLGTAVALVGAYSAMCLLAYASGARHLPDTLSPSRYRASAAIRSQYLAIEAPNATSLPKLNPLTFVPYVLLDMDDNRKPNDEYRVLMWTARIVNYSDRVAVHPRSHHLPEIATAIKISRQWTLDEAANTILAESGFRKDVIGIEAAAEFYFGVPAAQLRPQESLALVALLKGPSWYDPFCTRERFEKRYMQAVEKLGETGPEWTAAAGLSRLRPIECTRR